MNASCRSGELLGLASDLGERGQRGEHRNAMGSLSLGGVVGGAWRRGDAREGGALWHGVLRARGRARRVAQRLRWLRAAGVRWGAAQPPQPADAGRGSVYAREERAARVTRRGEAGGTIVGGGR